MGKKPETIVVPDDKIIELRRMFQEKMERDGGSVPGEWPCNHVILPNCTYSGWMRIHHNFNYRPNINCKLHRQRFDRFDRGPLPGWP